MLSALVVPIRREEMMSVVAIVATTYSVKNVACTLSGMAGGFPDLTEGHALNVKISAS